MARPRKAPGEGRSARLAGLRLTDAERAYVELLAERHGRDVADYCRRAILGQPMRPPRSGDHAALIVALNRVGNNLNQIAARLNAADELAADARKVLADVRAVVASVMEATG